MKHYLLTLSLALCAALAPAVVSAHKYHTSVTRVEYNARERSAEITVQTFTDDLEDILAKRVGRSVRLGADKDADRLVFDYLRSAFELKRGDGSYALRWVGMEVKGETVWLYALAEIPDGLSKASVRNALLFDLFEDQVNIVNVISDGRKNSLVFKRGDGARVIP